MLTESLASGIRFDGSSAPTLPGLEPPPHLKPNGKGRWPTRRHLPDEKKRDNGFQPIGVIPDSLKKREPKAERKDTGT